MTEKMTALQEPVSMSPPCRNRNYTQENNLLMEEASSKEDIGKSMTILLRTTCVERMSFGREPAQLICKNCGQFVTTEISRHIGVCSLFTFLVGLFLCTPCAWVPLLVPTCKDTLHSCPNCGTTVGVHRYFK